MGTYRKEWPCCDSVTETQAWEPVECPFCSGEQPADEQDKRDADSVVDLIVRDVCEMDPADPDKRQSVCIEVDDLTAIVKRHIAAMQAQRKEQP